MTEGPAGQASDARGRTYIGPGGQRWPSFTTLTGLVPGKSAGLTAWRRRVGDEAADARLSEAIEHGNQVHEALETGGGPPAVQAWIERNFALVYGRELVLADSKLQAAGTVDFVALANDGVVTIVDWKTGARRPEHALQVVGYGDCDLVLSNEGLWVPWGLAGQVRRHLVGYIDRDGALSVQVARADDATRGVLAGLRAAWAWHGALRGALRAWKGE